MESKKDCGEIQVQINRLNELLDSMDKEISASKEAFSAVIVVRDDVLGTGIGAAVPSPVVMQSPLAHVLTLANERIAYLMHRLSEMRGNCQL